MSAETLRRAAALMRERAEWASLGPWGLAEGDEESGSLWLSYNHEGTLMVVYEPTWEPDAEHIASWHPGVALAVADWLDATAARIDAGRDPQHGGRRNHSWRGSREALAVARAYLGDSHALLDKED